MPRPLPATMAGRCSADLRAAEPVKGLLLPQSRLCRASSLSEGPGVLAVKASSQMEVASRKR